MASKEPRNEQRLCEAVMRLLAERIGEPIIKSEPIDTVVRDKPAVEWIYVTPSHRFAFEHTRIERFTKQIANGKQFAHLLEPLESELAGQLPGSFFLIVDVGAAKARTADHVDIRRDLATWILANAGALERNRQQGQPATVTLQARHRVCPSK